MRQANSEIQLDDTALRITLWRLPPQSEIGWHSHAYDYVVVPITDGALTVVDAGGEHEVPVHAGQSYARGAGIEHNVLNKTATEIAFVEIEIKRTDQRS